MESYFRLAADWLHWGHRRRAFKCKCDLRWIGRSRHALDISHGNGMYKSTDAGKTWTHIGLEDSRQIARIVVDPDDSEKVFVAALGHAYGPNKERGVFRSNDGGKTWQRVLFKDENTGAIDLAFEPGEHKHDLRRAAPNSAATLECLSALKGPWQRLIPIWRWWRSLGTSDRTRTTY